MTRKRTHGCMGSTGEAYRMAADWHPKEQSATAVEPFPTVSWRWTVGGETQ